MALPLSGLPSLASPAASPRIAIVGGGISGLCAALGLADKGIPSVVYEASTRLGGRMRSDNETWANGQYSDVFGELIDTSHTTVQSLAARYGLPLIDALGAEPPGATETYYVFGSYYTKAQADADFAAISKTLAADLHSAGYPTLFNSSKPGGRALDNMSIYDWIETRVPGGHSSPLGAVLDLAYNIEYGAETRDQSALNLLYLLAYQPGGPTEFNAFGVSDEKYRLAGGSERLPQAIAQDLGSRGIEIRAGYRLQSIAQKSGGGYELTFDAGSTRTVVADAVVLTVPFAAMRNVDYRRAGFDTLKDKAIRELGAGHNGKLQLQFTDRFWNRQGPWGISGGSSYSDTGYQASWDTTRGQAGATGILLSYTGGDVTNSLSQKKVYATTMEMGSGALNADAQRFLAQLAPVFPVGGGVGSYWNGIAAGSIPHLNPLFNCSYSYWRVGQYQTIAGYERVPQGNVFFAGEHTSIDFQGYMNGAAAEGLRAASEVAKAVK